MNKYQNSSKFHQLAKYSRTWLTYSQITGRKAKKEDILKNIQSINLTEALTILAKYSVLNEEGKNHLMQQLKPLIINKDFIKVTEPLDVMNLLYSVKWFLAYGTENPKETFNNQYNNSFNVFLTVLKITDYIADSLDDINDINAENYVLKSWLFNRPGEIDRALIRQHLMFQKLARIEENFEDFVDIHSFFEEEYGFTIKEYVSTLFAIHQPSIEELGYTDVISNGTWGINETAFFNSLKTKQTSINITNELVADLKKLKKWAKESLNNPFDYEKLLVTPLFKSGNFLVPFSPGFLNSTIFDGLCFKLHYCCTKRKKSFFSFFGRLFEQYVSQVLSIAVDSAKKVNYTFIDEFIFDPDGQKKSSDAYVLLGKSLLIFECKGGRLRKETKIDADPEITEEDYMKYALEPVTQANTAYSRILKKIPEKFKDVNKVYILSVSIQAFPRVPKYNETLAKIANELHPHVKEIDYIGLSDLELLAYIINNHDFSLFKFIKTKKVLYDYIPYPNYYYKKYGEIKRTDYLNDILKECFDEIRSTLF